MKQINKNYITEYEALLKDVKMQTVDKINSIFNGFKEQNNLYFVAEMVVKFKQLQTNENLINVFNISISRGNSEIAKWLLKQFKDNKNFATNKRLENTFIELCKAKELYQMLDFIKVFNGFVLTKEAKEAIKKAIENFPNKDENEYCIKLGDLILDI